MVVKCWWCFFGSPPWDCWPTDKCKGQEAGGDHSPVHAHTPLVPGHCPWSSTSCLHGSAGGMKQSSKLLFSMVFVSRQGQDL